MIRNWPPHSGQYSISIVDTRLKGCTQAMCAGGLLSSHDLLLRHGLDLTWCFQFGAITARIETS